MSKTIPPLGAITHATIHCSGSPAGRGDRAADVRDWDMQRFGQPSYHYVVDEEGTVTRLLTDAQLGAHVALHNHGNIGICYIGGIRKGGNPANPKDCIDTRTGAQKVALRGIVAKLKLAHPGIIVQGHRDWPHVAKVCPCFDVATQL
jgi:N-acetylmuramoyl-L-alanine amidase